MDHRLLIGNWRCKLTDSARQRHRRRLICLGLASAELELAMREFEYEAASSWLEVTRAGEFVSHVVGDYFRTTIVDSGQPDLLEVRTPNGLAVYRLTDRDTLVVAHVNLGESVFERERGRGGLVVATKTPLRLWLS
jgi:hypothetical protein